MFLALPTCGDALRSRVEADVVDRESIARSTQIVEKGPIGGNEQRASLILGDITV